MHNIFANNFFQHNIFTASFSNLINNSNKQLEKNLVFQCFGLASCLATSSSAAALEEKTIAEKDELSQTVQFFPLDPLHDHLGKENLWPDQLQLQQNSLTETNKHNKLNPNQLQKKQLHLHQLCLQDPDSTISRQLPEESLSSKCLSDSSLDPAASLSDNLSFSKQKLSEQDLSNNSFDKFLSLSFGQQLSEQQLQQNLPTDQQQLQENRFNQTNFQQLS